jgi:hypothetical protein
MSSKRRGYLGLLVIALSIGTWKSMTTPKEREPPRQIPIEFLDRVRAGKTRPVVDGRPYIRSKVLFIVDDQRSAHNLYLNLDGSANALGMALANDINDSVQTVIAVDCSDVPVGHYTGDRPSSLDQYNQAFQHMCNIDVLDVSNPISTVRIDHKFIAGGDPPASSSLENRGKSALPLVVDYVKNLPRR